jgi:hypothetical protein
MLSMAVLFIYQPWVFVIEEKRECLPTASTAYRGRDRSSKWTSAVVDASRALKAT